MGSVKIYERGYVKKIGGCKNTKGSEKLEKVTIIHQYAIEECKNVLYGSGY